MRTRAVTPALLVLLAGVFAFAQSDPPGTLQITALPSQGVVAGQNYTLPLAATGGSTPYTWSLIQGVLPPGLKLHPHTGKISGMATTPGEYHFTLQVVDATVPSLQAQRELTIQVIAGLTIQWKETPAVHGTAVSGSAIVTNQTANDFDLTVVIVAVNKIGRATTLGYQHFKLAAQTSSPVIPFGSSPGPGTYYVRADAVAHRTGHQHVYRSSLQTSDGIQVTQF
jgi:hypothetical protein